mgnify:CR=1 FL=1
MIDLRAAALIAVCAGVTMLLRFLPFLVFGGKKEVPGYITYLSWLRRDPDYSAYIKRLKAERRADMEARKAERMKNPRRARRTPAQHRVRKVS